MGVAKLWQLLEEAEEGTLTSLTDCSGQSWAVDLSAWIVHGHTAGMASKNVSGTYTMIRLVPGTGKGCVKNGAHRQNVMDITNTISAAFTMIQIQNTKEHHHLFSISACYCIIIVLWLIVMKWCICRIV